MEYPEGTAVAQKSQNTCRVLLRRLRVGHVRLTMDSSGK
jgi:hypothetical protein